MISADELCQKFIYAYANGWGYIWGKYGQLWTEAGQAAINRTTASKYANSRKYGAKWIGHNVSDCSGLFRWAYLQFDEKIDHSSNAIWVQFCSKRGKLSNGQRGDGIRIKPGTAVFLVNSSGNRHHIGLYIGNGEVIEAKGAYYGVVKSKLTRWHEWGELKAVDYSAYPDEAIPYQRPTLKKGDRGEEVKQLQVILKDNGYKLTVDGAFGSGTETAVKEYQKDHSLTVDGIAGPKTWAALDAAETQQNEDGAAKPAGLTAPEIDDDDQEPVGCVVLSYMQALEVRRALLEAFDIVNRALGGTES